VKKEKYFFKDKFLAEYIFKKSGLQRKHPPRSAVQG
jgi:hypothetical protein